MANNTQQAFSSVLSNNPYKGTYFTGISSRLTQIEEPVFSKDQYAISFLNTKSFITALIGISKNIPDEDIYDAINSKTYEELALDMAVEYDIKYVEAPNNADENNRFFHVFVADPLTIEEDFASTVERIKYIDQIVPVPLLLKGLYDKEIIEDNGVHCFIYFQENDAFFTIYNEEEFVYTKSLKYSFSQMHDRFCELLGEQVDFSLFMKLLSEEGLSSNNTEYQKYLIKLFGEIFLHINDVLTYAKRAFEIDKIAQIYIGSQIGVISGLDEYSQTYLGLSSSEFNFDYGFESDTWYVDQVHALMHIYTQIDPEDRYDCNFTVYHRPPPFLQRQSGKLILLTAVSLMAALAYPITFWTLGYAESINKTLLDEEYKELHNVKVTREATINLKLANKSKVDALLKTEQDEFTSKRHTLTKIHEIKVNYPMKARIITDFTKDLNKFAVKLTGLKYSEEKDGKYKIFALQLDAKHDKQITQLLEYWTKNSTKKYRYILTSIEYDGDKKRYHSELKAVMR